MKNKIVIAALSLCFALPAMAQQKENKHDPRARAEKVTEAMAEKYGLTDDQKETVYEANVEYFTTAHENREKMKEQRQQRDERLKEVLTEDQYAAYEARKAQRREKMKEHRAHK